MVYHNLYYLLWENELPEYHRNVSCECIVELTELELINTNYIVKRQFEDYKNKGIPSESFLAHDLTVISTEGILEVKNDLIICRENPDISTTLTISDGAQLDLYGRNQILVRKGNIIHITNGGVLNAGIGGAPYYVEKATITLEEGAKLIVDDGGLIQGYGGLTLVMHANSEFIMNDGTCAPATDEYESIFFDAYHALIDLTNSTLISNTLWDEHTSTFELSIINVTNSEFTFLRGETSQYNVTAHNCGFLFDDNASFNISASFAFENGLVNFVPSSHLIISKGAFRLKEAEMYWDAEDCVIEFNSILRFDNSELHLGANTIFQPTHQNTPSGYIEFVGYPANLYTGQGSIFRLIGDGPDDVMLKINDNANLWNANYNMGAIYFQDCAVDLNQRGHIWTDMEFTAINVNFFDDETTFDSDAPFTYRASIESWYNNVTMFDCNFHNVGSINKGARLRARNTHFNGYYSGVFAHGGEYNVDACYLDGCKFISFALDFTSKIRGTHFYNSKIEDASLVELKISECTMNLGEKAIKKTGGKLSLKCNHINGYSEAIVAKQCKLNMSAGDNAGYNVIHGCNIPIKLIDAEEINLYHGYNDLSEFGNNCILGSLNMDCETMSPPCYPEMDIAHNFWGYGVYSPWELGFAPGALISPLESYFVVYTSSIPTSSEVCNIGPCGTPGFCRITFRDRSPVDPAACRDYSYPIIRNLSTPNGEPISESYALREEENYQDVPMVSTDYFNNITLDSALIFAALQTEAYDSLGSDEFAIELFHQILLDSLDKTNLSVRKRMDWGRYHMKSALENMFVQEEIRPSDNQIAFQTPVQQYVDILNLLTDTILADSTYRPQFYLEIDKGQMFRTIEKPFIAQQIYSHLNDCQLDSIEQSVLNFWLHQVEVDISVRHQYVNLDIPNDSIVETVDTSAYSLPMPYAPSNYYFGLWIDSPNEVTFVSCGDDPIYRNAIIGNPSSFNIFPNPSNGDIQLISQNTGHCKAILMDLSGRMLVNSTLKLLEGIPTSIDLPEIANGTYLIRIESENFTEDHLLVIQQ